MSMRRNNLPTALQKILDTNHYVTIATVCPDGRPWNTPNVGYFDDGLNLYWQSASASQHSQNIAGDPQIFVVIYDSHATGTEAMALYFEMRAKVVGTAEELDGVNVAPGGHNFSHRDTPGHRHYLDDCPQRVYHAVPVHIWYNDEADQNGHQVDIRLALGE